MNNPMNSEYLTWYVLNDKTSRKGVISLLTNVKDSGQYNFSVDYQEDYDDVLNVISKLNNPYTATTKEILENIDGLSKVDLNKEIKLPGTSMLFHDYLKMLKEQNLIIKKEIKL
jgi:spore coat polysaccharide biosynthesis protein SpsF (cytidylyltransferase family)